MSDTVLGEYFLTSDRAVLFVLRRGAEVPEAFELDVDVPALRRWVRERFSPDAPPLALDPAELDRIGEPLVRPLLERSDPGDTLWLVPHDVLHHVPLQAVAVDGEALVARNPVCSTPSAAVMRHCQANRTGRRERAVVFGDSRGDLAHAREEALRVAELLGTEAVCGATATKARLLARLAEPVDLLHFSCHGYFRADDPMESGVVLADDGSAEPNLTADEILELQLDADLVTVTACESGVSDRRAGDELIGLARALLFAGTPSVVVTRWRVDDLSTTLVVERFYDRLLEGGSTKAQALRDAQLHVRDLTARDVLDYCDRRGASLAGDDPAHLFLRADRARALVAASDIDRAIAAFEDVAAHARGVPGAAAAGLAQTADDALDVLELRREEPWEADYEAGPFRHPYHWAATALIGDWR